jgi:hypothetical protein
MSLAGFNAIRKKQAEAKALEEMANIESMNIEDMSFAELKKFAKSKGVKIEKTMKQEDIIEAIQALEKAGV